MTATTDVVYGGDGSIEHTFDALGDMIVRCIAVDKDGGRSEVQFKVKVLPSKTVMVTPVGPHPGYSSAEGLGNGIVRSIAARTSENRSNVYYFQYDPSVESATLEAIPYKADYRVVTYDTNGTPSTSSQITYKDSFFYVWQGEDQGLNPLALLPENDLNSTYITLPEVQADDDGNSSSVEIRQVSAIFSEEYYIEDNQGDINMDRIPDSIAESYGLHLLDLNPAQQNDLENRAPYNGDEDYLPVIYSSPATIYAPIGDAFTAVYEVRGFGLDGLNYISAPDPADNSITVLPLDEPGAYPGEQGGTDPTKDDDDGDGFPDGWEYYFWYNAKINGMTGERYDPNDVAQGTLIESKVIEEAFNPIVPSTSATTGAVGDRDIDNDGLLDVEELVIGTNPADWDTDGDSMCDGWEVLRNLNPTDSRDGLNTTMYNPDGDYMAFATLTRQWVTAAGGGETNHYISLNAAQGDTNGTFYAWYNYGDTNAPIALGQPVDLPDGAAVIDVITTNVLIMHFQVRDEFGYDPRTAWTDSIDTGSFRRHRRSGRCPQYPAVHFARRVPADEVYVRAGICRGN